MATATVDRYLQRIGLNGPLPATLTTLEAIAVAHPTTIAFENLNPLTGATVALDHDALVDKLVARDRGGYCFEQNLLLQDVLDTIGFRTTALAARVVWNEPDGAEVPRTHLLLRVDLPDGPRIVDTAFGGLTLTGVLRLDTDAPQPTPHGAFRLVGLGGGERQLDAELGGTWVPLYRFGPEPQLRVDVEVANWFTATHPGSIFVQHLMAARPAPDRRYALLDATRIVHHLGGPSERTVLADVRAVERVLEEDFLLDLSGIAGLRAALTRITGA